MILNRKPRVHRSPKWRGLRQTWLRSHSYCSVCNTRKSLEVHHILPVHLFPERELDASNLITLCEQHSHNDHFIFGHLFNWKDYNPVVVSDASVWRLKLEVK